MPLFEYQVRKTTSVTVVVEAATWGEAREAAREEYYSGGHEGIIESFEFLPRVCGECGKPTHEGERVYLNRHFDDEVEVCTSCIEYNLDDGEYLICPSCGQFFTSYYLLTHLKPDHGECPYCGAEMPEE